MSAPQTLFVRMEQNAAGDFLPGSVSHATIEGVVGKKMADVVPADPKGAFVGVYKLERVVNASYKMSVSAVGTTKPAAAKREPKKKKPAPGPSNFK